MEKKVNIPMCLACVLLCLTLISMHLTGGLYARYTARDAGEDSARVAKFLISGSLSENVTVHCAKGEEGTYTVTLKNQSEVAVYCDLTLRFDLPMDGVNLSAALLDGTETKTGTAAADRKSVHYARLVDLAPGGEKEYTLTFTVLNWTLFTETASGQKAQENMNFTVDITATQID